MKNLTVGNQTALATGSTSLRWIATGGELLLMVWSIPAVILLFGLPFVLVLRLIVEIGEKLFGR